MTANGVDYKLYSNGSAYDATGVLVTTTGVEGLRTYLTTTTTVTQTIVPDFQTVTANGVDFKMFNNGSVYDGLGVWVTEGGVEGIRGFITSGARIGSDPNLAVPAAPVALFLRDSAANDKSFGMISVILMFALVSLIAVGSVKVYQRLSEDPSAMKFQNDFISSNPKESLIANDHQQKMKAL